MVGNKISDHFRNKCIPEGTPTLYFKFLIINILLLNYSKVLKLKLVSPRRVQRELAARENSV